MTNARPLDGARAAVSTRAAPAIQPDSLSEIHTRLDRIEKRVLEIEPVRLLPAEVVVARIGFSRGRLYELIASGDFPKPTRVGRRALWLSDEIRTWIEQRRADRDAGRVFAPEVS